MKSMESLGLKYLTYNLMFICPLFNQFYFILIISVDDGTDD